MLKFGVSRGPPSLPIMGGFAAPIPRLNLPVKNRQRGLKNKEEKSSEGRLLTIKRLITDLFRYERVEMSYRRADECRLYAERLIQLAIAYGDRHQPTMDMADYWLTEKDLVHKLFKVLVPRYHLCHQSFTRQFRLPTEYKIDGAKVSMIDMAVLELRGNLYPRVVPQPEIHDKSLLNGLLAESDKVLAKVSFMK